MAFHGEAGPQVDGKKVRSVPDATRVRSEELQDGVCEVIITLAAPRALVCVPAERDLDTAEGIRKACPHDGHADAAGAAYSVGAFGTREVRRA